MSGEWRMMELDHIEDEVRERNEEERCCSESRKEMEIQNTRNRQESAKTNRSKMWMTNETKRHNSGLRQRWMLSAEECTGASVCEHA